MIPLFPAWEVDIDALCGQPDWIRRESALRAEQGETLAALAAQCDPGHGYEIWDAESGRAFAQESAQVASLIRGAGRRRASLADGLAHLATACGRAKDELTRTRLAWTRTQSEYQEAVTRAAVAASDEAGKQLHEAAAHRAVASAHALLARAEGCRAEVTAAVGRFTRLLDDARQDGLDDPTGYRVLATISDWADKGSNLPAVGGFFALGNVAAGGISHLTYGTSETDWGWALLALASGGAGKGMVKGGVLLAKQTVPEAATAARALKGSKKASEFLGFAKLPIGSFPKSADDVVKMLRWGAGVGATKNPIGSVYKSTAEAWQVARHGGPVSRTLVVGGHAMQEGAIGYKVGDAIKQQLEGPVEKTAKDVTAGVSRSVSEVRNALPRAIHGNAPLISVA